MPQRSSIDRLPPEIRVKVDQAIKAGSTVDEILGLLLDLQEEGQLADAPSRSSVGRYTQQYRELAAKQRDMASVAKAFGEDFGDPDDRQSRLLVQLLTSLATRAAMSAAATDEEIDFKELHYLARSVKDALSAAKLDVEREAKIREEASKRAREQAAKAAESTAKAAGASAETIRLVKAAILGIDA